MLKYKFPNNFNSDFKAILIQSFEPIFSAALSQQTSPANFTLNIEDNFGDQADAYLVDPSNFGHFLTISWEFEGFLDPKSFHKSKDQVQFSFSELPTEELQQFLQPNSNLPFSTQAYQFDFECWHFHGFKDITFSFACKRPLSSTELDTLRFYIYDIAFEYKKEAATTDQQVDHVAEKLVGWYNQHYTLSIDMGNADHQVIGQMLEAVNNIDVAKVIKSIQLL
ncbi:MAG: hypothetical protein GY810_02850 [Aureispira sp.]|nr:hypothetical protein [Aureispira sp.]